MRCKNCGLENDDNLYICQNCGSPLYDEDDIESIQENDDNSTRVFKTVNTSENNYSNTPAKSNSANASKKEEEKRKQMIIIIVVLAIILVAIIVGTIIAVAHNNSKDNNETESSSLSDETTDEFDNDDSFVSQQSTSKTTSETTSETTESTTKETTTKIKTFSVSLSCNAGGEVEGDGTYKRGDNVTIIARPDDGYDFDGWYNGDNKVSSNTKFTFTVTENTNLQAVFVIVNDEPSEPIDTFDGGED